MGRHDTRASQIIGPNGTILTFSDLPSPKTRRWVARRKAEVVAAVCGGLLTLDEACERYAMTVEEFAEWKHSVDAYGLDGLRTTHLQEHRREEIALS